MDDTLTIEFRHPVEHKGQTYTSMTLAEPTAGQLLKASSYRGFDGVVRLVAEVALLPADVIKALPISQVEEAATFLEGFTPRVRQPDA